MPGRVKAGAAFVEIGADDSKLSAGLKRAAASMRKFAAGMVSVGKKLMLGGAAMLAPLALAARSFAKFGDNAAKMSRRTGLAAQSLVEFGHVADLTGADISGLEKAFKRMQTNIVDAGLGLSTPLDALKLMGLTLAELQGLSPEEQFLKIGAAIGAMGDATQKAGVANKFFGRSGTQLLPMFALTEKQMGAARAEARLLYGEMAAEGFAAAEGLTDRFARLKASLMGVRLVVGLQLEPAISKLLDRLTGLSIKFRRMLEQNPRLIEGFKKTALTVTALGVAFATLGTTIQLALHPVILVISGVSLALLSILESMGVLNTGVNVALTNIFNSFTVFGKTLKQWAAGLSKDIGGMFISLFLGISKGIDKLRNQMSLIKVAAENATLRAAAKKADAEGTPAGDFKARIFRNMIDANIARARAGTGPSIETTELAKMLAENRKERLDVKLDLPEANKDLLSFTEAMKAIAERIRNLFQPIGPPVPSGALGATDIPGAAVPREFGVHGFFGRQNAREQLGGVDNIDRQQLTQLNSQTELLKKIERTVRTNDQTAVFA